MSHALSLDNHIEALREKHQNIEALLDKELTRPLPNQEKVHELKKKKLELKDEIIKYDMN